MDKIYDNRIKGPNAKLCFVDFVFIKRYIEYVNNRIERWRIRRLIKFWPLIKYKIISNFTSPIPKICVYWEIMIKRIIKNIIIIFWKLKDVSMLIKTKGKSTINKSLGIIFFL